MLSFIRCLVLCKRFGWYVGWYDADAPSRVYFCQDHRLTWGGSR